MFLFVAYYLSKLFSIIIEKKNKYVTYFVRNSHLHSHGNISYTRPCLRDNHSPPDKGGDIQEGFVQELGSL